MYPAPKVATSLSRVNTCVLPPMDVPLPQMIGQSMHSTFRAQVDTAAETTVTPHQHLLHQYCPYTTTFCCPIRLVAALDTNLKVSPIGEELDSRYTCYTCSWHWCHQKPICTYGSRW